jgi:hypothetical protein
MTTFTGDGGAVVVHQTVCQWVNDTCSVGIVVKLWAVTAKQHTCITNLLTDRKSEYVPPHHLPSSVIVGI